MGRSKNEQDTETDFGEDAKILHKFVRLSEMNCEHFITNLRNELIYGNVWI